MNKIVYKVVASISYSVVIRTLGDTGDKYKRLLDSLISQTVQPEEIIVVLPHGYSLDYSIGNERIVRCEKGMVTQRAIGIESAQSEYLLVVDDDVCFDQGFVAKLHTFLTEHNLDCVLPVGGESSSDQSYSVKTFLKKVRGRFTGQYTYSRAKSDYMDRITLTAGHKVYTSCTDLDSCYYAETGNFQCFYVRTDVAKNNRFLDECWLEQGTLSQYAAYDDATFFYKLFLNGGRIGYSLRSKFVHLDAAAGRVARSKLEGKRIRLYSIARNRTIFWYKFIYKKSSRKLLAFLGGLYGLGNYAIYSTLVNLAPKNWTAISALYQGYCDAYRYMKTAK